MNPGIVALVLILVLTQSSAQASPRSAESGAHLMIQGLMLAGLQTDGNCRGGVLPRRRSETATLIMEPGMTNVLVVAGRRDAYDVDLHVIDTSGPLVARDGSKDRTAAVVVQPTRTATFVMKSLIAHSMPDGAHWVLQHATTPGDLREREQTRSTHFTKEGGHTV